MLTRVVTSAFAVMGLALALACGGAETTDIEQTEGVSTEARSPAAEAVSTDTSAEILPGCGGFKQPCCELLYCNTGYECDPSTRKCLH
ncbi:MAG: hypothetical protein EOO71_06330 [Myxococcaceae bacterium]|nr:MAG: hypothetical protein EOO71_06330 [Myxococcaceae bacterium]